MLTTVSNNLDSRDTPRFNAHGGLVSNFLSMNQTVVRCQTVSCICKGAVSLADKSEKISWKKSNDENVAERGACKGHQGENCMSGVSRKIIIVEKKEKDCIPTTKFF